MASRPQGVKLGSQSDERLVSLARAGDERAFAAIVERYRRELLAHAGRMRSDGRADDLVQQTFLSAFAALRSGTEVRHLRGWLYRILRNEVIRTSSRSVLEVELDPASIASEPLEEASQRRMLAFETLSSIAALPTRQRHAIVATALDGESRAAVAVSMGVSEGAVRQLMHRARAALRAAVAAFTPSPLANWLASGRGAAANQAPEILVGAGTTSGAGLAVKLGAILATGALATGVVGSQLVAPSGHRGAGPMHSIRRAAARNQAVTGVAGAIRSTGVSGAADVRATGARARAGSGGGGLSKPTDSGRGATAKGRGPVPGRAGASGRLAPPGTAGSSRGDGGSGGDHDGAVGRSPLSGATTGHEGGGSTGGDGSGGGGGSTVDGGSGSTSGRDGSGGDAAAASTVGVAPASTDGGHDGGSSGVSTVSTTGSSDGGASSSGGSTDGPSSAVQSSDGGSGDSGTSGSSSSGS